MVNLDIKHYDTLVALSYNRFLIISRGGYCGVKDRKIYRKAPLEYLVDEGFAALQLEDAIRSEGYYITPEGEHFLLVSVPPRTRLREIARLDREIIRAAARAKAAKVKADAKKRKAKPAPIYRPIKWSSSGQPKPIVPLGLIRKP